MHRQVEPVGCMSPGAGCGGRWCSCGAPAGVATPWPPPTASPSAIGPGFELAPTIGRKRGGPSATLCSDAIHLAVTRHPEASMMAEISRSGPAKTLLPLRPFPAESVGVMLSPKKSKRRPKDDVARSR